ncbi:MAG: DNA polymerase I [Candidatus Pacebacteria bacterium]|nr:DNA polymerase I [Candidatus Paceibacterota bacterium]
MKRLAIIDSYALAHRSYHALPPLTSPEGVLVNGVYGFMLIFLKMLKDLNPDYVLAAFDMAAPTFRHQEYKEYKAKRVKMPDNFYEQVLLIKDLLKEFGVPILEKEGYEADDLIGTVVDKLKDQNVEIFIVTGDLDTLQLVNDKVFVYTLHQGLRDTIVYNREKIRERFHLEPEQLGDWKALRGDPSDNVPGVPSIGEKTAEELIKNFDNLNNLYKQLRDCSSVKEFIANNPEIKISPRVFKNLKDFEGQAYFSRHLVMIDKEAPFDFDLEEARFQIPHEGKLKDLLNKLGFQSLLPKIFGVEKIKAPDKGKKLMLTIKDLSELEKLVEKTKKAEMVGLLLDFEGEKWGERKIKGLGISFLDGSLFYLPKGFFNNFFSEKIDWQAKKIISFEAKIIFEEIEEFPPVLIEDIKILAWLLDPDRKNYTISSLGKFFLKQETVSSFESFLSLLIPLWEAIEKKINILQLENVWEKIEKPLIPVISLMEENGALVDEKLLRKLLELNEREINDLEKQIYQIAGRVFNINSYQQLSAVLFGELKIASEKLKKTSKMKISTNASELSKIENEHPIVPLLIKYRALEKLKNSFLKTLPAFINNQTKRIHTIWNQSGTATGRLSSEKPNLQSIPQGGHFMSQVRQAFIAEEYFRLVSFDYSQIELRVAAYLSQDKTMIEIFKRDKDIHLMTAAYIHNIPEQEVTSEMRNQAKALNFGIIYGMGDKAFAETAKISLEQAKIFRERYFSQFSGLKNYLDASLQTAKETGYAQTMFGRKRLLPFLGGFGRTAKEQERIALNMPIQGSAADIIKMAMIKIQDFITSYNLGEKAKILIQIHDELILEIKFEIIEELAPKIKDIMETVVELDLPLKAEARAGKNWGEMKTLGF